ncbi:MAG: hypothetical protein Q4G71_02320 [Pseudomonadota bacterium]|nr:hypothetical protein [Pseudomonadota bacterium]
MSVFNEVIAAHEKAKAEQATQEEKQRTMAIEKDAAFRRYFDEMVQGLLLPEGTKFVQDAEAYGFPSEINAKPDGKGNPYFSISVVPKKGVPPSPFGYSNADKAVFSLQGLVDEKVVLVASYYDQRVENGVQKHRCAIGDITPDWLNTQLKEFLSRALRARNGN